MKISVNCESILLQQSINAFLKEYLTSPKHCDIIVTDKEFKSDKKLFLIGKDIKKPFTKKQLLDSLNECLNSSFLQTLDKNIATISSVSQGSLELQITQLTEQFRKDLIETIKNYYEK